MFRQPRYSTTLDRLFQSMGVAHAQGLVGPLGSLTSSPTDSHLQEFRMGQWTPGAPVAWTPFSKPARRPAPPPWG